MIGDGSGVAVAAKYHGITGKNTAARAGFASCRSVANYHGPPGRLGRGVGGGGGNASSSATTILLEILRLDGEAGLRERLQDQVALSDAPLDSLHAQLVEEIVRHREVKALAR